MMMEWGGALVGGLVPVSRQRVRPDATFAEAGSGRDRPEPNGGRPCRSSTWMRDRGGPVSQQRHQVVSRRRRPARYPRVGAWRPERRSLSTSERSGACDGIDGL